MNILKTLKTQEEIGLFTRIKKFYLLSLRWEIHDNEYSYGYWDQATCKTLTVNKPLITLYQTWRIGVDTPKYCEDQNQDDK